MSYETKVKEPRIVKCPFCDKGEIETVYTPSRVERQVCRGSGMNKTTLVHVDDKYTVNVDCAECGKKAGEIERVLNKGEETKSPSNKDL